MLSYEHLRVQCRGAEADGGDVRLDALEPGRNTATTTL